MNTMMKNLILIVLLISCKPIYQYKNCPNSPFPEAKAFLDLAIMKDLKFNLVRDLNDHIHYRIYQTWVDEKINFRVGLYYIFFGKIKEIMNKTENCCQGITLTMPYPLSDADLERTRAFLKVVGDFQKRDFNEEIKLLESSNRKNSQSILKFKELDDNLIFEISIEHSWNRGDKLFVGFYTKDYYSKFLDAKTND